MRGLLNSFHLLELCNPGPILLLIPLQNINFLIAITLPPARVFLLAALFLPLKRLLASQSRSLIVIPVVLQALLHLLWRLR